MHWADRSTRASVAFLTRTLRQERVCVLLTYRADELHRRHPLRPLLSELERLERARRIELEPFDRAELDETLTDILGAAPSAELLERLYARSEGNALYTEELLAAGLDGRGAAPRSLRDAFLVRIERLSPEAQRIARAVAAGRALDEPLLAAVTGLDRDRLQSALRETVAEQILVIGDGQALQLSPLPPARGAVRRSAARRARRAASGAGRTARSGRRPGGGRERRRRAGVDRGDRRALRRRRGSARRPARDDQGGPGR